MTEDEFRADLLAASASRAETHATGMREAFVAEVLERLRDADELPDAESCSEVVSGQRGRKLEIDAFAFDEADDSLQLFLAVYAGDEDQPSPLTLTEAQEQGFRRLLGFFEQSRDGWITKNMEESRPLWALARRIETGGRPAALRLNLVTDRPVSERLKEIAGDRTGEGIPVTFQIWDLSRLKRIHEAGSVRDDLHVDFSSLSGGGLAALPAVVGVGDYDAYLTVIPGEVLADIYIRHGSRLLEGNVRTFLGRRGNTNKGIASTLANEPARFFAYNNGIAATASSVTSVPGSGRVTVISEISDLQIVNGAQTTASLAALSREGKLPHGSVFVPMKLSVVKPEIAVDLIPLISRYSNRQNGVRDSDFFANHAFHRRAEEMSRRLLAPASGGSQVQTHWYYERARGQHLNDQAGMSASKKDQFLLRNPRSQVITKTDLAKIESCFDLLPDFACKGAEKSFTEFAKRVTEEWKEEKKRSLYGDDWYRAAVARVILFRTTESLVSRASWYEGGYRAQIVAYTVARLAHLAAETLEGGRLDHRRVWSMQAAGDVLERQLLAIAEVMTGVLRSPPQAGRNISEWAKHQACRQEAFRTRVPVDKLFETCLLELTETRAADREQRDNQRITDGLSAVTEVIALGADHWREVQAFGQVRRLLLPDDLKARKRCEADLLACSML